MKRLFTLLFSLTTLSAFAEDTKTEIKNETKKTAHGEKVTMEAKTTKNPSGFMNSTTDSAKDTRDVKRTDAGTEVTTEKMVEHDAPGMKNDSKTTITKTVQRDAKGNIIKEDVKVDVKK